MVWQRFAKSPRIACAGSTPVASAKKFLRSGRAGKVRVSETRLRRFESYLRSQVETLTRSTLES